VFFRNLEPPDRDLPQSQVAMQQLQWWRIFRQPNAASPEKKTKN
jgi:hypothetical protein